MSLEAIHWPGCCWLTICPEAGPPALDIVAEEPVPAVEAPDVPEELLPEAVEAVPGGEGVSDCPTVDEPDCVGEPPDDAGFVPTVAPALGCIAEEPEVVEPEPVAAGRSVPPDGLVLV